MTHVLSTEITQLTGLLREYGLEGSAQLISLGPLGYILSLDKNSNSASEWVLYDLDDTVIASWQAKQTRLEYYHNYCLALGVDVNLDDCKQVLQLTDGFARWKEHDKEIYHLQPHMESLSWATAILVRSASIKDAIKHIDQTLVSISSSHKLSMEEQLMADIYMEDIYRRVFRAIIEPGKYDDAVQSILDLGAPRNGVKSEEVAICIFTYGEPYFQLLKLLKLMELQTAKNKPLKLAHVWLAKTLKGNFLKAVLPTLPSSLKTLLIIDDSPVELHSIFEARERGDTGVSVLMMRTIRHGTKTVDHAWPNQSTQSDMSVYSHDLRNDDIPVADLSSQIMSILRRHR